MDNNAVTLALVAIVGTVITGMFKLLNNNTKAQNATANALLEVASSNKKIADEATLSRKVQEKGFGEAKQRNGHLAEIQITGNKAIMDGLAIITSNQNTVAQTLKVDTAVTLEGTKEVAKELKKGK
jgi:hypothetical protein